MALNDTNPIVIDATGYAPYVQARAKRADASGTDALKANRRAQSIRDYWQKQKTNNELIDFAKKHEVGLVRNEWECEADKKALYSRVRWQMDKIMSQLEKETEQRRARLSDLLQSEECQYLNEMSMAKEDPELKQERMLHRYVELKAQKEEEREQVAREKKEQQFKRNCEELRTLVSQKIQRLTTEEGRKIAQERGSDVLERNMEDKMYAEMWARDREAKDLKDTREEEDKRRRSEENGKFIQDQILKNHLEKQKKVREKEHDLVVMEERMRLAALEEQCEKELKKKKQAQLKSGLDQCTREKLKRRAQEVQNDLMQDLFFMKQIAESEEEAAKCDKKRRLLHEQNQYLKYLRDQIQAAADFEREVDRMYQEEVEKNWKKREEEWAREKKRRRELEKEVLDEVEEQIRSNHEKSRKVQCLNKLYSQKIFEEDAEHKKKAAETLRLIRERNETYQRELLDQIRLKEEELEEQKRKRDLELELIRREREEQERKIQKLLAEVKIDNEHPFRSAAREICCTHEP